jgi:hypothetical protein
MFASLKDHFSFCLFLTFDRQADAQKHRHTHLVQSYTQLTLNNTLNMVLIGFNLIFTLNIFVFIFLKNKKFKADTIFFLIYIIKISMMVSSEKKSFDLISYSRDQKIAWWLF